MELNEAVAKLDSMTEDDPKNYCEGKKHNPVQNGPNLIDGLTGTPTPERLLNNMRKHNERSTEMPKEPHIPKLPPKKAGSAYWDIEKCNSDTFPWQTHHLIPKKFLPTHPVCVWLTKKWTKHPEYQLAEDTRYSTDHTNNGCCLPFVSTCYDWKNAKSEDAKNAAAEKMMQNTKKQLHQGNHDTQDFDEEEGVELRTYLDSIKLLLTRIFDSAQAHTNHCTHCQQDGKRKIQPLHRIVDQADLASLITKLRIDANIIFISQRAYDYYKAHRQL